MPNCHKCLETSQAFLAGADSRRDPGGAVKGKNKGDLRSWTHGCSSTLEGNFCENARNTVWQELPAKPIIRPTKPNRTHGKAALPSLPRQPSPFFYGRVR